MLAIAAGQCPILLLRVVWARPPPTDDGSVGRFPLLACLAAFGEHSGRATRMAAARRPTLAPTHRVRDRVHGGTAIVRLTAEPALPASFSQADVHVLGIANRSDCGPALG